MILNAALYSSNFSRRSYFYSYLTRIAILSFACIGTIILLKTKKSTEQIINNSALEEDTQPQNQRQLYSLINNTDAFYSKLFLNENYNGKWNIILSNHTNSFISLNGNVKLVFNLKLSNRNKYEFNTKFIIYENNKVTRKTFLFSQTNQRNTTKSSSSISDYHTYHTFQGNTSSIISRYQTTTKEYENCTSLFTLHFNPFNKYNIKGDLISVHCFIAFQFEAIIEDKKSKDLIIHVYTILLDIICIISVISQLSFSFQIEGNPQRVNAYCLFTIGFNAIWSVYNIYANFYLLFINTGHFYQFALPIILFFFHFGCDMKIWILSIELKYNDTRVISIMTFFVLLLSFTLYFIIGMRLYIHKYLVLINMISLWYPQVIFNAIYFNTSLFPIFYLITMTIYRIFIPLYFTKRDWNFVDFGIDYSFLIIYLVITISSIILLMSQYIFGPRWFMFRKSRIDHNSLYKNKQEIAQLIPSADHLQCAICLQELFIDQTVALSKDIEYANVNESKASSDCINSKTAQLKNNRKNTICSLLFCFNKRLNTSKYMLTKCNHAFHSKCLELWLDFKNDCPNCRREIKNYY